MSHAKIIIHNNLDKKIFYRYSIFMDLQSFNFEEIKPQIYSIVEEIVEKVINEKSNQIMIYLKE